MKDLCLQQRQRSNMQPQCLSWTQTLPNNAGQYFIDGSSRSLESHKTILTTLQPQCFWTIFAHNYGITWRGHSGHKHPQYCVISYILQSPLTEASEVSDHLLCVIMWCGQHPILSPSMVTRCLYHHNINTSWNVTTHLTRLVTMTGLLLVSLTICLSFDFSVVGTSITICRQVCCWVWRQSALQLIITRHIYADER